MAQKPVDVTVNPGVDITVNANRVQVKKGIDTVVWRSTTANQQFTIDLGSNEPTASGDWQGNKWVCTAGPFNGDPRTIKYTVRATNAPDLDPDVEVIP